MEGTAKQGIDPGAQNHKTERLGNIVIRTAFQSCHNVQFHIPGCEQNNGYSAHTPIFPDTGRIHSRQEGSHPRSAYQKPVLKGSSLQREGRTLNKIILLSLSKPALCRRSAPHRPPEEVFFSWFLSFLLYYISVSCSTTLPCVSYDMWMAVS